RAERLAGILSAEGETVFRIGTVTEDAGIRYSGALG
ncbi:MAG: phosphoribosylformylglycinamidine cyclo-ligase, partial [Roseicyclus sp.]|nr:phosphoribosylformylglycinamidine cyclo-ligase [Roseicyclus sp.]